MKLLASVITIADVIARYRVTRNKITKYKFIIVSGINIASEITIVNEVTSYKVTSYKLSKTPLTIAILYL